MAISNELLTTYLAATTGHCIKCRKAVTRAGYVCRRHKKYAIHRTLTLSEMVSMFTERCRLIEVMADNVFQSNPLLHMLMEKR